MAKISSRASSLAAFIFTMHLFACSGLSVSGGDTPSTPCQFFLWYVLPVLPFTLLAVASPLCSNSMGALWGAAVGAALAIGVPWGLLWYSSATYTGGGANIGIGILLMSIPLYLPALMLAGFAVGEMLGGTIERKSQRTVQQQTPTVS